MKGHVQPILLYSVDLLLILKDVGSSFLLFVLVCVSSDLFCWLTPCGIDARVKANIRCVPDVTLSFYILRSCIHGPWSYIFVHIPAILKNTA